MPSTPCPCSPQQLLSACCGRYHRGEKAPTALLLMRSRYSAFALGLTDYIRDTTHPSQQAALDMEDIRHWSRSNHWLGLEIHAAGTLRPRPPQEFVEFTARYLDAAGQEHQHHERSLFVRFKGRWYFVQPN